jgi:hypothetical protein
MICTKSTQILSTRLEEKQDVQSSALERINQNNIKLHN